MTKTLTSAPVTECWVIASRDKYYDPGTGEYCTYYVAQYNRAGQPVATPTPLNARQYPAEPSIPHPLSSKVWTTKRLLISEA